MTLQYSLRVWLAAATGPRPCLRAKPFHAGAPSAAKTVSGPSRERHVMHFSKKPNSNMRSWASGEIAEHVSHDANELSHTQHVIHRAKMSFFTAPRPAPFREIQEGPQPVHDGEVVEAPRQACHGLWSQAKRRRQPDRQRQRRRRHNDAGLLAEDPKTPFQERHGAGALQKTRNRHGYGRCARQVAVRSPAWAHAA